MRADKRILIVDDDDAIRALLMTVLRRRGFSVDVARNGAEALERLRTCRYAVLLLDLMMPLMSGYEVLAALEREADAQRPIVLVLTAGTEPRNLSPTLVAGSVRKPFDVELLVDTVSGCLDSVPAPAQPDACPPADSDLAGGTRDDPN
jgi:DNA-binding response OmpR family regulator